MRIETFAVEARGIGRSDNTRAIERSVSPLPSSVALRQTFHGQYGVYDVPYEVWPFGYGIWVPIPQDDGTWDYFGPATMRLTAFNVRLSTNSSALVRLCYTGWASLADYYANIREYFGNRWGYGSVELKFAKGIATPEGAMRYIIVGCWPDPPTDLRLSVEMNALLSELTRPWMVL